MKDISTLGISLIMLINICENINPNITYESNPRSKGIALPFHLLAVIIIATIRTDKTRIAPATNMLTAPELTVCPKSISIFSIKPPIKFLNTYYKKVILH